MVSKGNKVGRGREKWGFFLTVAEMHGMLRELHNGGYICLVSFPLALGKEGLSCFEIHV